MLEFYRALKRHWEWLALALVTLAPRLYLLRVFDIELSQDGFEAVRTLTIWQTQGLGAIPRELVDRFILHPLYMLLLVVLRVLTPTSIDFYFVARLASSLIACVTVIVIFELVRRAYGNIAAWAAAILLAFAPTFLWESVAILSSTTFLALYLAVLLALLQSRYRLAALFALLASLVRYEGVVFIALTFGALAIRDWRARKFHRDDWVACVALTLAFPLTLVVVGWAATGNALQFIGAQSMAAIWLRVFAPGDFWNRGAFFITRYPNVIPSAPLGAVCILLALRNYRSRATWLFTATIVLYILFFEILVWLNYTTLEVRFLMYPGLPLLIFSGYGIAMFSGAVIKNSRTFAYAAMILFIAVLAWFGYRDGTTGMRYLYNSYASQREVADELARIVPLNQPTNMLAYTGVAGALNYFTQQRGLVLALYDFRFAPDDVPERYITEYKLRFVIYPVGNAFVKAKFPYLAQFETQTHNGVTFQPLTQFSTSLDNQLWSIWSVSY
ncbi:MAG: hypothetical protein HY868_27455 [Chloroflexi bacterium]|nr:hypothetical protein [Chloroflexota bacterium]